MTTRRSRAADTQPPTFGVCLCGHGEHAHELKKDNRTRTYCTLYHCRCKTYDEGERYSLRLVPQRAAGYGDPKPDED